MAEINVDRLTLELSGLPEREGRRLALLIAEALGASDLAGSPAALGAVRVRLERRAGEDTEALARRVAASVLGEIGARPWEGSR